jgi:hypothetical protein
MIVIPEEKSNIAWFKLAEFVMRKEKERALNIYRLLEHSFNNPAFAKQLEGDLLAAFHDEKAREKYYQAAYIYESQDELFLALLMYEKVLLFSLQVPILHKVIFLAQKVNLFHKLLHFAKLFIVFSVQQGAFKQAYDLIIQLPFNRAHKSALHELSLITVLETPSHDLILLCHHFNQIRNDYIQHNEHDKIYALLQIIEEKNLELFNLCQNPTGFNSLPTEKYVQQ